MATNKNRGGKGRGRIATNPPAMTDSTNPQPLPADVSQASVAPTIPPTPSNAPSSDPPRNSGIQSVDPAGPSLGPPASPPPIAPLVTPAPEPDFLATPWVLKSDSQHQIQHQTSSSRVSVIFRTVVEYYYGSLLVEPNNQKLREWGRNHLIGIALILSFIALKIWSAQLETLGAGFIKKTFQVTTIPQQIPLALIGVVSVASTFTAGLIKGLNGDLHAARFFLMAQRNTVLALDKLFMRRPKALLLVSILALIVSGIAYKNIDIERQNIERNVRLQGWLQAVARVCGTSTLGQNDRQRIDLLLKQDLGGGLPESLDQLRSVLTHLRTADLPRVYDPRLEQRIDVAGTFASNRDPHRELEGVERAALAQLNLLLARLWLNGAGSDCRAFDDRIIHALTNAGTGRSLDQLGPVFRADYLNTKGRTHLCAAELRARREDRPWLSQWSAECRDVGDCMTKAEQAFDDAVSETGLDRQTDLPFLQQRRINNRADLFVRAAVFLKRGVHMTSQTGEPLYEPSSLRTQLRGELQQLRNGMARGPIVPELLWTMAQGEVTSLLLGPCRAEELPSAVRDAASSLRLAYGLSMSAKLVDPGDLRPVCLLDQPVRTSLEEVLQGGSVTSGTDVFACNALHLLVCPPGGWRGYFASHCSEAILGRVQ